MTNDAEAVNDHQLKKLVRQEVDKVFEARQAESRTRAKYFAAGFTVFLVFLISFGFMTKKQIAVLLIDAIYPFEERLNTALAHEVAVSYNNVFWLGTDPDSDKAQSISFFSTKAQEVKIRLLIQHVGSGEPAHIRIWLDESWQAPIWNGNKDLTYADFDLTTSVQNEVHMMERPPNVHELNFEIVEADGGGDDKVIIKSLINVVGREGDRT